MCILRSQGYRRDNIQKWRFLMAEQAVRAPLSLYNRKLRPLLYKNAPRGSHCGGKENAAFAARRRRRILRGRILTYDNAGDRT